MNKGLLKSLLKQANEMKAKTDGTEIVYNLYANGNYILDTEEDNIISCEYTEQDAIDSINGINEESGCNTGCYYKPILIDSDSGKRITRSNLKLYLK